MSPDVRCPLNRANSTWTFDGAEDIKTARHCGIILMEIAELTGRREEGDDKQAHLAVDKDAP